MLMKFPTRVKQFFAQLQTAFLKLTEHVSLDVRNESISALKELMRVTPRPDKIVETLMKKIDGILVLFVAGLCILQVKGEYFACQ